MPKKKSKLRFAALIRVSTERQEKQGESLRTQATQIESAVESLGGKIVAIYAGQEHATSGWEREQRDKMLAEAEKARKPFDAVIVAHEDRWSRDDTRSGADLERLQRAGIQFYVLNRPQDLADPTVRLYLGMSALIGAYQARNQKKKAIENQIERIKRGIPAVGKMPFGRTFDRETSKWMVIPDKAAMVVDVAKRYLAGESLRKLAGEYGVNYANLSVILRTRCSDTWSVSFRADDLNINETLPMAVPRLLPEKTIQAVCRRLSARCMYLHGSSKGKYLLSGRIFCATCGCLLTGAEDRKYLYYRHGLRFRADACSVRPRPWVRADKIEPAVIRDLFSTLGNPAAIERAMQSAVPDCDRALKQQARLETELAKIKRARDRVLDLIERDTITDQQAAGKLEALKEREAGLRAKLDQVVATLADVPDAESVKRAALHVLEICGSIFIEDGAGNRYAGGNDVQSYLLMADADRRELVRVAFDGTLPDGRPAGVYVTPDGGTRHRPKKYTYVLRGRLLDAIQGATQYANLGSSVPCNGLPFEIAGRC